MLTCHVGIEFEPQAISDDVARAIDYVHTRGAMHKEIMNNFGRYAKSDPRLLQVLKTLQSAGKDV